MAMSLWSRSRLGWVNSAGHYASIKLDEDGQSIEDSYREWNEITGIYNFMCHMGCSIAKDIRELTQDIEKDAKRLMTARRKINTQETRKALEECGICYDLTNVIMQFYGCQVGRFAWSKWRTPIYDTMRKNMPSNDF